MLRKNSSTDAVSTQREEHKVTERVGTSGWRVIPGVGYLIDLKNWMLGTEPRAIAGKTVVAGDGKVSAQGISSLNTDAAGNALEHFEAELNELQNKLNSVLQEFKKWIQTLSDEMTQKNIVQKESRELVKHPFISQLQSALHQLADFFKSPDTLLREIEQSLQPDLKQLEDQIKEKHTAFRMANDEAVKYSLQLEMLTLAIETLNKLIEFVNAVQGTVRTAHARKEFEHKLLNDLANLVVKSFISIPLPTIDLEPAYLNNLYTQIAETKGVLDQDFNQAEIALHEARKVVVQSGIKKTEEVEQEIDQIIAALSDPSLVVPPHLRFQQAPKAVSKEKQPEHDSTKQSVFVL